MRLFAGFVLVGLVLGALTSLVYAVVGRKLGPVGYAFLLLLMAVLVTGVLTMGS